MQETRIVETLRDRLVAYLAEKTPNTVDQESIRVLIDRLFEQLEREGVRLSPDDQDRIRWRVFHAAFDFGPINDLMADPDVTEIMINGPFRVFAERKGHRQRVPVAFEDERQLRHLIERLLALSPGKRLDGAVPLTDMSLPDGTRIHAAIPPVVAGGPHLTIRKYVRALETLDDYVAQGAMSEPMARFLHACVRARQNMLFAGATGAGKTALLEVLSSGIDDEERVIVIEDTLELHLRQPDVVRMLTRSPNIEGRGEITIRDLFRSSLRMRPTRIVLGEIRGREVVDYLNALNSGHRGSFGVIHAASPQEAIDRIEHLVPYGGVDVPPAVVRRQIAHGLDLIVQIDQLADGSRKITRITEIAGANDEQVELNDLFCWTTTGRGADGTVLGRFEATGTIPRFQRDFTAAGLAVPETLYAVVPPLTLHDPPAATAK